MSACVPWCGVFIPLIKMGLNSYSLKRECGFWRVFCSGQLCKTVRWAVLRSKVALPLSHLSVANNLLKVGSPLNLLGVEPDAETANHTARD